MFYSVPILSWKEIFEGMTGATRRIKGNIPFFQADRAGISSIINPMSKAETTTLKMMFLIEWLSFCWWSSQHDWSENRWDAFGLWSGMSMHSTAMWSVCSPLEKHFVPVTAQFLYLPALFLWISFTFFRHSHYATRFIIPDWIANTTLIVTWLRQDDQRKLPMIAAVMLLVTTFIGLKRCRVALGAMVFLLSMSVIVQNNFWWHPDSLSFSFIALVFYFLNKDELRFGKYFGWLCRCLICGRNKAAGFIFRRCDPRVLLILGISKRKISVGNAFKKGILFIVVMIGALIISNPLLLLPQERSDILFKNAGLNKLAWKFTLNKIKC